MSLIGSSPYYMNSQTIPFIGEAPALIQNQHRHTLSIFKQLHGSLVETGSQTDSGCENHFQVVGDDSTYCTAPQTLGSLITLFSPAYQK